MMTDDVGYHNLQGWRLNAICAARWLLRAAALENPDKRFTVQVFKELARAAELLNDVEYQHQFSKLID